MRSVSIVVITIFAAAFVSTAELHVAAAGPEAREILKRFGYARP
jgi:hypothetical protein